MALNYDLRNVKNYDAVWDENEMMRKEHKDVIFATMYVNINEITEDNKEEFYLRHKLSCQASGYEPYLSEQAIDDLVGMGTNAKPLTRAKFKAEIKKHFGRTIDNRFRRLDEDKAKAFVVNANDFVVKKYEPAERLD